MGCDIYMYCDEWYCFGCLKTVRVEMILLCLFELLLMLLLRILIDVMIMMIMMILIWDDIVNKDHVNMNCYYWWICEYEMRLLLLLITSLRWDDIHVVNDMEIRFVHWCWKCIGMCMLCMSVGGTVHWPLRVFGTSFWPRTYTTCTCQCISMSFTT